MSAEPRPTDESEQVTTSGILTAARRLLLSNPRVLAAFVLAGAVVTAVDALRRGDPVPSVGFVGLLDGNVSVEFGVLTRIPPHERTPLSALPSLYPRWLAWTLGLELLRAGAVIGAGVYGFARTLEVSPGPDAVGRYVAAFAILSLLSVQAEVGLVLGIPLLVLFFAVLVRVIAFPVYLVDGRSTLDALRQSWHRTRGHGWPLFGIVLLLGFAHHAAASIPAVGPLAAGVTAAAHVGTVAGFVRIVR